MATAIEDGTGLPIILRLSRAMYACFRFGNETFAQLLWYCMSIRENHMNKNPSNSI